MINKEITYIKCILFFLIISATFYCYGQQSGNVRQVVTLDQAHVGSLHIDTLLLDSYGVLPENIRQFYLDARFVLSENTDADFTHPGILKSAQSNKIKLMGGPMLGDLAESGVSIWLRSTGAKSLTIKVYDSDRHEEKSFFKDDICPGLGQRIKLNGLTPDTDYNYIVFAGNDKIAGGSFTTTPNSQESRLFRLAFGSCFHKIGLHNPNIISQV
ncbi:MAG TPA: hypothetical protein VJ951_01580, partial [Bacteroidales bacterium]|nr:hypothetical protein [Bacteroidales bacterium]